MPKLSTSQVSVFGDVKLTIPAYMVLVAYIILLIVVMLPFKVPYTDEETNSLVVRPYSFYDRLLVVILMLVPVALSVYSTNCMMTGSCVLYSYLVSTMTVVWVAAVLFLIILTTARSSK